MARMRLFGRRSKKGTWSSQAADETTKAEDSDGPRVLKKKSRAEPAVVRYEPLRVGPESLPKATPRAVRSLRPMTKFQPNVGDGTSSAESVVALDSASCAESSRRTTSDIQNQHSSTVSKLGQFPRTIRDAYNSDTRDKIISIPYHSQEFSKPLSSGSSRGILENKPLPPNPDDSWTVLPEAKRPLEISVSTVSNLSPTNVVGNSKFLMGAKNQTTYSDTHKSIATGDTLPVQTAIIPLIDPANSTDKKFPQTEAEAKDHITAIKNRKIERFSPDLEHALDILSNTLCQNALHFLLEIFQNADDNTYKPPTTPTMNITYEGGAYATLRFDTNEIGFCMADVESICGIGNSSKKEYFKTTKQKRIGEKGIGFKSVFGVSDEVFITSGHYSFKFNNGEPSGRLAPTWEKFPQKKRSGFTSIYLQLRPDLDKTKLVGALQNLDGRHLMFLRQLKKVDISLLDTGINKNSVIRLVRREGKCNLTGLQARMVAPGNFSHYALFSHTVSNLPPNNARKHQTESDLILAFPISTVSDNSTSETKKHEPDTHNVYAFLPVRDYGFKIVIQADFILVASREEIDSGSEWNRVLLKNIPKALLAAINRFNTGPFRFSWLRYLPLRQETHDFFQNIWQDTQEVLSREQILMSAKNEATVPSALRYYPKELADKNKRPLIPVNRSKFNHVSQNYPCEASETLKSLGVKQLSAEDFLDDLSEFIATYPNDFQHMPNEWHSQLSSILDSLTPKHEQLISLLPIIPLRDGKWIPPTARNLLFPLPVSGPIIPDHLDASVIHEDAANDPARKSLLRKFQVQDTKNSEVCRIILETHESEYFKYKGVPIATLISHATFLYKSGHKPKGPHDTLWIVASDGARYPSRQAYMELLNPDPAVQILLKHNNQFHFLHKDYYMSFSKDEDRNWLVKVLGVAVSPRLIHSPDQKSKSFAMHDDFRFLINSGFAQDVLQILKICWMKYRPLIAAEKVKKQDSQTQDPQSEDEAEEASRRNIRATLSAMTVQCCDGSFSSLEHTFLPRKSVLLGLDITSPELRLQETESKPPKPQSPSLPLLRVPDPEAGEWDFLENFNVVVKLKAEHLISRLQELKSTAVTKEQVLRLYERLQNFTDDEDVGLIKRRFKEELLVFIPENTGKGPPTPRWVSTDDCVWDTLSCLRRISCLVEYYDDCKALFCATIGLGPATYKTIIAEAKQIEQADSLNYIAGLFTQLSQLSSGMSCDTEVSELQTFPIFPVSTGDSGSSFKFLKPAGELSKSNWWYIADKTNLRENFVGRIPLLAFDDSTMGQIGTLIDKLGCGNRKLSKLAIRYANMKGWSAWNEEYTLVLRAKWKYIARLIPVENSNRIKIATQLRDVWVYKVQSISILWQFTTPWGDLIEGPREKGRVKLVIVKGMLQIYLTEKDDMKITCPPPQLITEMSQFCGITNIEHNSILYDIFIRQDARRIENNLKEHDIPDQIPEISEHMGFTADRDGLKANDSAGDEVNYPVELLPSPGGAPSPEPKFHPSFETRWGRVPGNADTPEKLSETNTGSWGQTFWPSLVPRMGGGVNYGRDTEERMFQAEQFVSSFLEELMGKEEYKETVHWTSYLRGIASHTAFHDRDPSISTFTIQDTSGLLTKYLVKRGHIKAEYLQKTATFYIQVSFSQGAVNSTFTIGTEQVKKAKEISCSKGANDNIFILALVFNLDVNPMAAMVVDPWKLHHDGSLSLEAHSKYRASFQEGTQVFYVGKANTSLDNVSNLQYRSLKAGDIRLLELSPGEGDVQLHGTIHHVPITSPGSFWAISYVWGAPVNPDDMHCPSLRTPEGLKLITQNLDTVLKRLRKTKVSILLWADAVCIDQDNKSEKGLQIRLMGDIFHNASKVVAWIGGDLFYGEQVLESLKSIPAPLATSRSASVNMGEAESTSLCSEVISTWDNKIWRQIDQLMNRPWFRRAWITQELVLAPADVVIMCGRSELDWDHFFEAISVCEKWHNSRDSEKIRLFEFAGPVYSLGGVRQKLREEGRKHRLLELLELFQQTQASQERDKLFALLGLANDSNHDGFNPDYDSSLEDIVQRYASVFVRRGDAMELLYRSGSSNPNAYTFCSWIPNWTGYRSPKTDLAESNVSQTNFPHTISTWEASGGMFYAGKEGPPTADIGIPPTLEVTGYEIDTISITQPVLMGPDWSLDCMKSFWTHIKGLTRYPTGETSEDILLWLPIGKAKRPHLESEDDILTSYRQFLSQEIKDWPDNFQKVISSMSPEMSHEKYDELPYETRLVLSKYWKTSKAFSNRLSNALLCFTVKGYIGLCPGGTVADDKICLLHGGRVPFVVRKRDEETHTLVGECYIHGIMHGEAMKMNSNLRERRFQLV